MLKHDANAMSKMATSIKTNDRKKVTDKVVRLMVSPAERSRVDSGGIVCESCSDYCRFFRFPSSRDYLVWETKVKMKTYIYLRGGWGS